MDQIVNRVLTAALQWQETIDLLVASAPLPEEHPASKLIIARASEAHMELLHAIREYREATLRTN